MMNEINTVAPYVAVPGERGKTVTECPKCKEEQLAKFRAIYDKTPTPPGPQTALCDETPLPIEMQNTIWNPGKPFGGIQTKEVWVVGEQYPRIVLAKIG